MRELLAEHGLVPTKALGQNFVVDPNLIDRIVRLAAIGPTDHVLEIGTGLASLTRGLVDTGASVRTLEIDRGLIDVARALLADTTAEVLAQDATTADWSTLLSDASSWTVVANLPYNIAATLVLDLLEDAPMVDRFVVMMQKEVADRLCAAPGTAARGIPSVKRELRAEVVGGFSVSPEVFWPRPRVDSSVLTLQRCDPPSTDLHLLGSLVDQAFGQRRKMLRRSLRGRIAEDAFAVAGVDPEARPEALGLEEWVALTEAAS